MNNTHRIERYIPLTFGYGRYFTRASVMAALGIAYYFAGRFGLNLAVVHPSATAIWAPTGITLVAFLVLGYRVWPGILVGAFFLNVTTAGSVATSLGIAIGNTLEGLFGAYLMHRYANGRRFVD